MKRAMIAAAMIMVAGVVMADDELPERNFAGKNPRIARMVLVIVDKQNPDNANKVQTVARFELEGNTTQKPLSVGVVAVANTCADPAATIAILQEFVLKAKLATKAVWDNLP